jgi:hypothetical protein
MKRGIIALAIVVSVISLYVFSGFVTKDDPRAPRLLSDKVNPYEIKGPVLDNPSSLLNESFEGVTFPPAGWTKISPDGGTGWERITAGTTPLPGWNGGTATTPPGGGTATAYCSYSTGGATTSNQYLITPQSTNIQANDSLMFWLRKPGYTSAYADTIEVRISTTSPTVAGLTILVGTIGIPSLSADSNWTQRKFKIGNLVPAGSNIYVGFRNRTTNNQADGAAFQLDLVNITVGSAPVTGCGVTAGQWAPANTYPTMPAQNYFSASAWLGDTLYVQSAGLGVGTTTMYRYTWNGTWTTGVAAPSPKVGASLTAANGKLYLIGGGTAGSITTGSNTVHEYNPATGGWTAKANLPAALSGHGAVNWGDSVIFVVGGPYTGAGTNLDVHYYRLGSDTWGTITGSLPSGQGRRTFALGISGNKIVMSGGFNTAFLKSTYVGTIGSNATQLTWAAAPDIPTSYTGLSRPGAASFGKYFFVINGERATLGGYYDTTHVFNTQTNTWLGTVINNIPFKRSNVFNQCVAKCINDTVRIFIPGGYGNVVSGGTGAATDLFDVTRAGVLTGVNDPVTSNIPDKYALSQNYPNPFNPVTKISYSIPKESFVTIKVFDITGKEVATLLSEIRGAGNYEVNFDGSKFASGVYFYRLSTENFVETKRMMLVK